MLFKDIQSQDAAIETLRKALHGGRLAQAYLFSGPSGVGKRSAAIALAAAANCEVSPEGCGSCAACKRILSGQHPDVRVFPPRDEGNRNLPVEFVREEILPFTKFAPFEAKMAFVIFPEADISFPKHHAEAANAILKTLEEPRPSVVFLLQSERPSRLLSTIRSRCQQVRFGALPSTTLLSILSAHAIDQTTAQAAVALSEGRADRALLLCEEGKSAELLAWAERIEAAITHDRPGELLDIAEALARSEDRELILETLCLFYRDIAAVGLGSPDLIRFRDQEVALKTHAARISPSRAAERVMHIERVREQLARNANAEIALDALCFGIG